MRTIDEPGLSVRVGINEAEQETDFMNSTLQGNGKSDKLAFSIATHLDFLNEYDTPDELAEAIVDVLRQVPKAVFGTKITFEVEVGYARSYPWDE